MTAGGRAQCVHQQGHLPRPDQLGPQVDISMKPQLVAGKEHQQGDDESQKAAATHRLMLRLHASGPRLPGQHADIIIFALLMLG